MSAAEDLTQLLQHYRALVGDVDEALSPRDQMFDGEEHYRHVGESAIRCVKLALLAADRDPAEVRDVLDLPSGHGRVLRYLQQLLPHARFTACDIDRDGVDFCAASFGATPVYGAEDPRDVTFATEFDLIWVGSLFTHLNERGWERFLARFAELLRPGGLLLFTAAGRTLPRKVELGWDYGLPREALESLAEQYREQGFGFVDYPEHAGYGISIARPDWTLRKVCAVEGLSVLLYREWGWDAHQDLVACIRAHEPELRGYRGEELAGIDFGG